jgi:Fic family protein
MVKLPDKAPDWRNIVKSNFKTIFQLSDHTDIRSLIEKTDRLYYYWDKVRSQPLPQGLDKKEVWAFLRLRRYMNSSASAVLDVKGKPFTFWLTDEMQKNLHFIDQSTAGNLALWDPGIDKTASTKYMVSSLMEEAITSSQIEGAVATIKEAKKMLLANRKPLNISEKMIYNNFRTMQALKERFALQDLTFSLLKELHVSITRDTLESCSDEGHFRTTPVTVSTAYGDVLFTPPPANELQKRLESLIEFANDKSRKPFVHPVIKAIILHFWMAYIHPFADGNGRLARTLFYWYMLKHGYWLFEYTSISKSILKRTTQYANAYLYSEHDDNDLTYFINFHINIIIDAVEELKHHIQTEREKNNQIRLEIAEYPDLNIRQSRIIHHLLANPNDILTIKIHQNSNHITYQTARTDLLELEAKGWLKSVKKGKTFYFLPLENIRERVKENTQVMIGDNYFWTSATIKNPL